jgi:hypothetical protein
VARQSTDTGKWRATNGINYPPGGNRAEAGETIPGEGRPKLLAESLPALLEMDAITPLDATAKKLAAAWRDEQDTAAEAESANEE